jgi:hypothetical protein
LTHKICANMEILDPETDLLKEIMWDWWSSSYIAVNLKQKFVQQFDLF